MTLSNFRVEVPGQRSKAKDFILYDRNLRFVRTGYGNIDLIQSHSVEGLSLPFHSFVTDNATLIVAKCGICVWSNSNLAHYFLLNHTNL